MLAELWAATQQVQIVKGWTALCEGTSHVRLHALEDLDGDGVSEVGVSFDVPTLKPPDTLSVKPGTKPGSSPRDWDHRGVVRILSGRTGETIRQFTDVECGLKDTPAFGWSVAVLHGPRPEDGSSLVIGHPRTGGSRGQVTWLDPATGKVKFVVMGEGRLDQFGWDLVVVHDLDGDGQDDVAVTAAGMSGVEGQHMSDSYFSFRSGATGAEIRRFSPDPASNRPLMFRADDMTGDGVAELGFVLVLDGDVDALRSRRPKVLMLDLVQETMAWEEELIGSLVHGGSDEATFASSCGDLDGDGTRDILLGMPRPYFVQGYEWHAIGGVVYALSGATGKELRAFGRGEAPDAFGTCLAVLGDVNGDGAAELAVGSAGVAGGLPMLRIVDGKSGEVLGERSEEGLALFENGLVSVSGAPGAVSLVTSRSVAGGTAGPIEVQLLSVAAARSVPDGNDSAPAK